MQIPLSDSLLYCYQITEGGLAPDPTTAPQVMNRNGIERMFGRLKDYRRIAVRYDKNADNFMAALCLAALICYWI